MKKTLLIIGMICTLLTQSLTVFASEEDNKNKAALIRILESSKMVDCESALKPIFAIEQKQFMEFLETNFQNKSSNSSLLNIAIARYQTFKENLNNLFAKLDINDPSQNYLQSQTAYTICLKLKDQASVDAKKAIIDHIKKTTAAKTTTVLLEKYQSINSKLRDLNTSISQMYGYFMSFKAMLPGFVGKCLTSG
jgi:hypothetical protein